MTDAIQRGHLAQTELGLTEEAFETIRQRMVDSLLATTLGDKDLRERLYMGVNALDTVRKALKAMVLNGQHEEALEEMQKALEAN
jgi:hypothetical protein